MLKSLITYLNLKLDLLNYFDLTRCLVELKDNSEVTRQPVEYISNGNYDVIDWDEFNGVSYWRLRDEITSDRTEERKYKAGARNNIETTVPLKLVFAVPRAKLTEDDAYSFDRIRQTMVKQFAIDDDVIKTTLQAESVRINVVSANSDAKEVWEEETESTGTFEPKYETVFGSIDVDVVIISNHSCLPTECEDVESDIIRAFDWCGNTAVTFGRLTEAQQTCISDFICSCADATVENSDGSYSNTVASGGTLVLPDITVTDSDGSTSSVPSVQDVTCTPCETSASVNLVASSTNVDFGDEITLTATPSDFTGTVSYSFSVKNSLGNYVNSALSTDNTFVFNAAYAGTYEVHVYAMDTEGNSAWMFIEITVGTLEAKYAIDATYADDVTLVGGEVDEWADIASGTYTASAPSAAQRCFAHLNPLNSQCIGVSARDAVQSSSVLETSLQLNGDSFVIYGSFNYLDLTEVGAAYNQFYLLGSTISTGQRPSVSVRLSQASGKLIFYIEGSGGSGDVNLQIDYAIGINTFVAKADGSNLRVVHNGSIYTAAIGYGTQTFLPQTIALFNTRIFNDNRYKQPFPWSTFTVGIKTAAITDGQQDQLYNDLLIKYPAQ